MAEQALESAPAQEKKGSINLRGAVFIGIGSMVGAGIFALFGEAGVIAGAAVWVSFLTGGIIALLQGYSFAKLGSRYPSSGGLIDWIVRGFGKGLFTGGVVMLGYFSVIIVTAMVAVSFGNYATSLIWGESAPQLWVKVFAVAIVVLLTFLNSISAEAVTRAQTVIVTVVLIVLSGFAIAMLANLNPSLLAPSGYPPMSYILASVALTFFAYLGFGVISFSGGDIENPQKNMPRAMYIAIGFTMLLYVALAIGVFGTLTVDEVIANADTALAVAALPIFGAFGYTMISIAAVFATTGAINSQLYASIGATYAMAKDGHLPPIFGLKRRRRSGGTQGLVISAMLIILLAVLFDVSAIASIGSAVALAIFVLVTVAHLRMVKDTGASRLMLYLTLVATSLAILLFAWYTLLTAPQTFAILVGTIILAWVVEGVWRAISKREVRAEDTGNPPG
ncbi:MAG TPA: APC family permease [Anaerolineales bacterium]|nr:APC family permease [Anaerolineales bacterium]